MTITDLKLPSGKYRIEGPQLVTGDAPASDSRVLGLDKSNPPLALLFSSPQEWDIQAMKDRLYAIKYEQKSLFSTPIYLGYTGEAAPGGEIVGTTEVAEWLLLKDKNGCYHIVTESEYGLLFVVVEPSGSNSPSRLVLRELGSDGGVESWLFAPL